MKGINNNIVAINLDMPSENVEIEAAISATKRPRFQKHIMTKANGCGPILNRIIHLLSLKGLT